MFQKILVIDDTPAMAQLAESVLARQYPGASVDVLFAQRGLDAFARMQVAQPDLILLSDSLPDLRAEAVCMRLLSDTSTAAIPVYLVNQTGEADVIEDLYQNVSRVLPRPLLYDTMAEIMGKVVALPRPLSPPSR